MRTTLNINDRLLAEVRAQAVAAGKTLTSVVEEALWQALYRRSEQGIRAAIKIPRSTARGGLRRGIELTSTSAVLAQLDEWDAADRRERPDS